MAHWGGKVGARSAATPSSERPLGQTWLWLCLITDLDQQGRDQLLTSPVLPQPDPQPQGNLGTQALPQHLAPHMQQGNNKPWFLQGPCTETSGFITSFFLIAS